MDTEAINKAKEYFQSLKSAIQETASAARPVLESVRRGAATTSRLLLPLVNILSHTMEGARLDKLLLQETTLLDIPELEQTLGRATAASDRQADLAITISVRMGATISQMQGMLQLTADSPTLGFEDLLAKKDVRAAAQLVIGTSIGMQFLENGDGMVSMLLDMADGNRNAALLTAVGISDAESSALHTTSSHISDAESPGLAVRRALEVSDPSELNGPNGGIVRAAELLAATIASYASPPNAAAQGALALLARGDAASLMGGEPSGTKSSIFRGVSAMASATRTVVEMLPESRSRAESFAKDGAALDAASEAILAASTEFSGTAPAWGQSGGRTSRRKLQESCRLRKQLQTSVVNVRASIPSFDSLCCSVASALAEIAFDLGSNFARLLTLISAVQGGRWEDAVAAGEASHWCVSNRNRCGQLMPALSRGCPFVPQWVEPLLWLRTMRSFTADNAHFPNSTWQLQTVPSDRDSHQPWWFTDLEFDAGMLAIGVTPAGFEHTRGHAPASLSCCDRKSSP